MLQCPSRVRKWDRYRDELTLAVFSPTKPPELREPPAPTGPAPRPRRLPDMPHRYRPWPARRGLQRLAIAGALGGLTIVIVAFAGAWTRGGVPFDGPGEVMHLHLALDQWRALGKLAPWLPQMWTGTPIWSISASIPVLVMLPFASLFGVENAVKFGCLGAQVLGATGAFVLARTLWGRGSAAVLAGLFYGLAPIFVAHSLFGADRMSWVLGITPWTVWALRRCFRGEGRRGGLAAMVGAGLLCGIAVLEQGEQAYSLGLLAGCLFVVELMGAGAPGRLPRKKVLLRGVGVVAIGLGLAAHWVLPFLAMSKQFVLSPPATVQRELTYGIGGELARDPGGFLTRSPGVGPSVDFTADLIAMGPFYLGWLLVVLTTIGMALLPRHDKESELTPILLASAFGVWLSTGAIPLAASGPAERRQVIPFILVGAVTGILLGTLLRSFRARQWAIAGGVATGVLLISLPYLTPFRTLQRFVPLLDSIRFPRFYTVALLGLALGAAFPVAVLERRLREREPRLTPLLVAAVSLALAGLFLVDLHSYRSYYEVYPPDISNAYARLARSLEGGPAGQRVATLQFGNPAIPQALIGAGLDQSTGWPHPIASKDVWNVTAQVLVSVDGYKDRALALSATAGAVTEQVVKLPSGHAMVDYVDLERNPLVLPKVRAYDRIVVASDDAIATEMAIRVSQGNVGTVAGKGTESRAARVLGPDAVILGDEVHCKNNLPTGTPPPLYAGEVAMGCAASDRLRFGDSIGGFLIVDLPPDGAGAIFESPLPDLQGVGVWFPAGPSLVEMSLYELDPDGRSLGQEVRHTLASGVDDNGLISFTFDPIKESEHKRYVFVLRCPRCPDTDKPAMIVGVERSRPGDLVISGKVEAKGTGVFVPLYAGTPPVERSSTVVRPTALGSGKWRIETSGPKPSLVVVAEAWFPGWSAKVDGKRVPVEKADAAFLGVAVGPGDHVITLEYKNPSVAVVGRFITLVTVLVAIFLAWPTDLARRARAYLVGRQRDRGRRDRVGAAVGPGDHVADPLDPGLGEHVP